MIITTMPDVALDGRYSKAESCRRLGEQHKPINIRTLNSYISRLGINPKKRRCSDAVFLTGADIIKIWKYSV